jgi:hypothetical protein
MKIWRVTACATVELAIDQKFEADSPRSALEQAAHFIGERISKLPGTYVLDIDSIKVREEQGKS